jgi:malonyl-CoA O-methyltransferase
MDKGPVAPIDKRLVAGAFSAAAARYDEAAQLQREVGDRLLERLELVRIDPRRILDVGAGTGRYSERLGRRYRRARVVSLDIAPGMLAVARSRTGWFARRGFLCADAECLPLADASVELLFSNLTLQWCTDLDRTFAEFRRVLRPGGLLMFSTLGPDTLKELRASGGRWTGACTSTPSPTCTTWATPWCARASPVRCWTWSISPSPIRRWTG